MRNRKAQGFTLIELLIVIAIIGILAAVLIPNLLQARKRAFDTATQTCLKEISTHEEMLASTDPWLYSGNLYLGTGLGGANISACDQVTVVGSAHSDATINGGGATTFYAYNAAHANGGNVYHIELGGGVEHHSAYVTGAAVPATAP